MINYRSDGRIEWICPHGIGHTISVPEKYWDDWAWWVHGCDECHCVKERLEKGKKIYNH